MILWKAAFIVRRAAAPTNAGIHLLNSLVRHRSLVWAFAVRDFRTRYRNSALGWVWSLLQPLAQLTVFAVVFSVVFRVTPPTMGRGHGSSFVLFLFVGLVAFNLFQGLLTVSMTSLRSSGDLLRKVSFPAYAPVLGSALVHVVQALLELSVLLVWLLVARNVGHSWLAALLLFPGLVLMAQGIGLVLASANARYADVQYIVTVLLSAIYFITPILYPISAVPDRYPFLRVLIKYHPLSLFVQGLHSSLYLLRWPSAQLLITTMALGVLTFLLGLWIFERTTDEIGELL